MCFVFCESLTAFPFLHRDVRRRILAEDYDRSAEFVNKAAVFGSGYTAHFSAGDECRKVEIRVRGILVNSQRLSRFVQIRWAHRTSPSTEAHELSGTRPKLLGKVI